MCENRYPVSWDSIKAMAWQLGKICGTQGEGFTCVYIYTSYAVPTINTAVNGVPLSEFRGVLFFISKCTVLMVVTVITGTLHVMCKVCCSVCVYVRVPGAAY